MRAIFIFISIFVSAGLAHAALIQGANSEYGVVVSEMLPNGVYGIPDLMPFSGLHYGHAWRKGTIEGNFLVSNAHGSSYYLIAGGLRGDVSLGQDFTGFVDGGLDSSYYSVPQESSRKFYGGFYVGTGAMLALNDNLWLRSGMRFYFHPGMSLFLNVGIVWRVF